MSDERTSYVGKFERHPIRDSVLFGKALVQVIIARLSLSMAGYRKSSRLFRSAGSDNLDSAIGDPTFPYRAAWAVSKASRIVRTDKPCLAQALVLRSLLSRTGVESTIVIGVKKNGDAIKAHAWVEKEGEVLIGGASSPFRYTVLSPTDSVEL